MTVGLAKHSPDMPRVEPYFREAGAGRGVVCLHSNASNGNQWRSLMELLAADHHVLAPDLYGAGKSPDWHSDREIRLSDEVRFIEPVFARAGEHFSVIGHSYGGAVALIAALENPKRIRSLVLYEPTLFSLVADRHPPVGSVEGIQNAVHGASTALDAGDRNAAAEHFIDFWMGKGTWQAMPGSRKGPIAESVVNVRRWSHALLNEPTRLEAFASLDMPVLYLMGQESPESARAVERVLSPVMPNVEVSRVAGWGHMAPITHSEAVNARIAEFLRKT
ncbi:MAG: alpha/beta hydrolase [Pseudomonadota bacterium]|nr:alpha/beta hydrolase [Pseudomonadota bacterium]